MTPLYTFLNAKMRERFDWSSSNCCFFVGDWIAFLRGEDPAAEDRMTFNDFASCQKATGFFRDPVGVFGLRAKAAGLARTDAPAVGDIGVVRVPQVEWPVAGIMTDSSWAFLAEDGVSSVRHDLVRIMGAWSVGYQA